MFRIRDIDHIVLRARDVPRMVAFYRDVLGCPVEKVQDEFGLYQLRAGNSLIDIVDVAGKLGRMGGKAPGKEGRNMDHLCLRVEPWDGKAIDAYLRGKGIEPGEIGRRYGADGYGPSIYFTDPEGNMVELKGPGEAAASAVRPGSAARRARTARAAAPSAKAAARR
jgi:glyoxylase I family protein